MRALRTVVDHGRRMRTTSVAGFLPLYLIAGLRRWRRVPAAPRPRNRPYRRLARLPWNDTWRPHPALALEILKCRRLIKGYSDTHARVAPRNSTASSAPSPVLAGRPDAADWLRRLREAALADEPGVGPGPGRSPP